MEYIITFHKLIKDGEAAANNINTILYNSLIDFSYRAITSSKD